MNEDETDMVSWNTNILLCVNCEIRAWIDDYGWGEWSVVFNELDAAFASFTYTASTS